MIWQEFKAYAKKAAPQAAEADVQQAFEWAKKVTHKGNLYYIINKKIKQEKSQNK